MRSAIFALMAALASAVSAHAQEGVPTAPAPGGQADATAAATTGPRAELAPYQPGAGPPVPVAPAPAPPYPPPPQYYAVPYPYAWPPPAAQPAAPPPGFHKHDGFFLRFGTGGGYLGLASHSSGTDLQASGAGFATTLSIGGSLVENLELAYDETIFFGEAHVSGTSRVQDASRAFFGFIHIAPALTYYFMPHNFYVSGSFGLGMLFLTESRPPSADVDHKMNMGWGATLAGGKEWWTSDNWGLGAAARFAVIQSREEATRVLYRGYSFALLFSATYN